MDSYKYFSEKELSCHCGCGLGQNQMCHIFMGKLIKIRDQLGFPLPITSAARCRAYNDRVSPTGLYGPHTLQADLRCHAVDIKVYSLCAWRLVEALMRSGGFTGIGIKQRGLYASRFIHVDDIPTQWGTRPRIWSY